MARPIAIYREGEDFYVPYFEVKIEGRQLPNDIVRDVMQVNYKDSVKEIDAFELTINNWDAREGKPKYEPPFQEHYAGIFDPGQDLELSMGYLRNYRPMLLGEITTIEPNFPASGGSTLSVRGLNILHRFRQKQHTWTWSRERDSHIARELGRQPVSRDRPGLGIEVRISDQAADEEEPGFVFMDNQYDIVFLMERARRHGYGLYVDTDEQTEEQFLHFGPSQTLHEVTYKLEWGKSLVQFRPTLTTANQVSQVVVRGWNRRTRRAIEVIFPRNESEIDINQDQHAVARAVQARREVIVDRPVRSVGEARSMARDIFNNIRGEMIKASGATVGLPDLRAGRKVHITNLGSRFSGEYFITETTHSIGDDGYRTAFMACREREVEAEQ